MKYYFLTYEDRLVQDGYSPISQTHINHEHKVIRQLYLKDKHPLEWQKENLHPRTYELVGFAGNGRCYATLIGWNELTEEEFNKYSNETIQH